MFKRIFLWLLMIALPLQGFAAISPAHCEAHKHATTYQTNTSVNHTHALVASDTHSATDHHHANSDANHNQSDTSCHTPCSMMVSSAMALPIIMSAETPTQNHTTNLLTAILDTPQRPPRTFA